MGPVPMMLDGSTPAVAKLADAGEGGEAAALGLGGGHDHEGGGAVVDAARVAGGDGAVLAEGGAELGHAFDGGVVADVFVVGDHGVTLAALDGDGDDLVLEAAGFLGSAGLLLAGLAANSSWCGAGDLILGGDVLCGGAHVVAVEGVPEAVFDHGVDEAEVAHLLAGSEVGGVGGLAHALLAAGDERPHSRRSGSVGRRGRRCAGRCHRPG